MRLAPVAMSSSDAVVVDLLADRLLHPHAGAAGAAAHALGAVAAGLDDLDAAELADDLARARGTRRCGGRGSRSRGTRPARRAGRSVRSSWPWAIEPLEELAVVHDLVVAAELRVLVQQRVEAVRALRDDLLHAHAVERLDVLHGEHLEDVLVARAAGRVAGAVLGRAEDGEVDAGPLHELGHGLGDLLVLVVERAGAADPVEVLVVEAARCRRRSSMPSSFAAHAGPVALAHAPRVAAVLHRPVGGAQLGREVRLHQRQVAPHVEDLVEDLDVDRADLVARLARRAGPHLLGRDALEQRVGADGDLGVDADRRRHRRRARWRP